MRTKKRFGQHLIEAAWADRLVAAIDPRPADRFLEIGPGAGALTLRLAPKVERLTAVEIDRSMVERLAPRVPPNVTLVCADFLDFDLAPLDRDAPIRVAGNLPYNVSSPILFKLIDAHLSDGGIRDATVMLQAEVADRIAAPPGGREYGVLSILIQLHADVRRLLSLPPGAFRPVPKVRSAVLGLRFRAPAVALRDPAVFEAMVRSIFTRRRKTLLNALEPFAAARGADPGRVLRDAGIDSRRRAETLQLEELARVADVLVSGAR